MKITYLDNNATTRIDPAVRESIAPYLENYWGNPSSMHTFGDQVRKAIERARAQVAGLLGAAPSEIIFTGCGSESNNMAIRGGAEAMQSQWPHLITSRVEHPAVLGPCHHLESSGSRLTKLEVDHSGGLDLDSLRKEVSGNSLVSIMWANNESGVLFPIRKIAEIVKSAGALLHVDAVQAAGKIRLNMREIPIDMLSISGHKLHAPKGVGALYVRSGIKLNPLIYGGHQERGLRAGTENVIGIVGMGRASELVSDELEKDNERVAKLRDRLKEGIFASCQDVKLNGDPENCLPNTLNLSFKYIEGEAILLSLNEFGICVSTGSACASGSLEPSHVLRAMHVPDEMLHGSIRFSLSRFTTEKEIDYVLEKLPEVIERLRSYSPFL